MDLVGQVERRTTDPVLEAKEYAAFKRLLESSGCRSCALSASRTRIVVDRGNPEARILVVGEAPGENEDRQGRVFVGRAGQLFDGLLASAGLQADFDTLLVNVVKCRPPDNRPPSREEVAACQPYFRKQLSLTRARWVLLLGATALRRFFPEYKGGLGGWVGRFFDHPDHPGMRFMPVYHPAYLLRDPRRKPLVLTWLEQFKAAVNASQRV